MPKDDNTAAPAVPAKPAVMQVSLDEFCAIRSKTDRRVELLAGFHAAAKAGGHIKDTEAGFAARLDKFANSPA